MILVCPMGMLCFLEVEAGHLSALSLGGQRKRFLPLFWGTLVTYFLLSLSPVALLFRVVRTVVAVCTSCPRLGITLMARRGAAVLLTGYILQQSALSLLNYFQLHLVQH